MKRTFLYIVCSQRNGTLYIGVTENISRRMYEHQNGLIDGFPKNHKVKILVHLEEFLTIQQALARERKLKHWKREWKLTLIEESNPNWDDLSKFLLQGSIN